MLIRKSDLHFYVLAVFFTFSHGDHLLAAATDTLTSNQTISDGQSLTSANRRFKLGFFSPSNSSSNRYVGIWYNLAPAHDPYKLTVVWVANRETPVNDTTGVLKVVTGGADSNLQLLDGRTNILWETKNIITNATGGIATTAKLLDSGNLVLLQTHGNVVWNSFDHLTDTFLLEAKMFFDSSTKTHNTITSWKSPSDPSPGNFMLSILSDGFIQAFIMINGSKPFMRLATWNGQSFIGVPSMVSGYQNGYRLNKDGNKITLTYTIHNDSAAVRLVLDPSGHLREMWWNETTQDWYPVRDVPENTCGLYGSCGQFALCNFSSSPMCSCLQGFVPRSSKEWAKGNWSDGCVRRTQLGCEKNNISNLTVVRIADSNTFLKLEKVKLPDFAKWLELYTESDCVQHCETECTCLAYAYVDSNCMVWYTDLLDMRVSTTSGQTLYIKTEVSELDHAFKNNSYTANPSDDKKNQQVIIIVPLVVVLGTLIFAGVCIFCRCVTIGKGNSRAQVLEERELTDPFDGSTTQVQGMDFLLFDLSRIMKATDYFSVNNKLGEGGFGPVYKGVLEGGKEIAVKRLSTRSKQGLKEFKTEVLLISKLQHRNLVRLLGYCLNVEEKLLIYEFMPNKSLDAFLFGTVEENLLDWSKRFQIIEGIAQGLLYLHRDSRLTIIHRDLKASNILLDADLNPKISDFGTARIFGADQTLQTKTIIGTHGYMSPEYAMRGLYSDKSDVYSFGVLLLEIVTGERINTFYDEQDSLYLLGYAWKLWKEGNALELVNKRLRSTWPSSNATKCINVALLCVQELAADRPTMSSVVSMLNSDGPSLPTPKEPAFTRQGDPSNLNFVAGGERSLSRVGSILTELEGR